LGVREAVGLVKKGVEIDGSVYPIFDTGFNRLVDDDGALSKLSDFRAVGALPVSAVEDNFPGMSGFEPMENSRAVVASYDAGRRISTVDEWFEYAPPVGQEKHWVDGRSAKEVAKAWCGSHGTRVPPKPGTSGQQ
jgi:hypothetical protein